MKISTCKYLILKDCLSFPFFFPMSREKKWGPRTVKLAIEVEICRVLIGKLLLSLYIFIYNNSRKRKEKGGKELVCKWQCWYAKTAWLNNIVALYEESHAVNAFPVCEQAKKSYA